MYNTGRDRASKSHLIILKPFANAWQANCTDSADDTDWVEGRGVYPLLQRIRALTHLALLTHAVHKEPEDCGNILGTTMQLRPQGAPP